MATKNSETNLVAALENLARARANYEFIFENGNDDSDDLAYAEQDLDDALLDVERCRAQVNCENMVASWKI